MTKRITKRTCASYFWGNYDGRRYRGAVVSGPRIRNYLETRYPNHNTTIELREELNKPVIESDLYLSGDYKSEKNELSEMKEKYELVKGEIKKKDRARGIGLIGFLLSSMSGISFFVSGVDSLKRWRLYSMPLEDE